MCWKQFKVLYWFHDDRELINGWASDGAAWILQPMSENLWPVFKLRWMRSDFWRAWVYRASLLYRKFLYYPGQEERRLPLIN